MEETALSSKTSSFRRGRIGSLLTLEELEETMHHLSADRIREMAVSGYMPHYKIDGKLLFDFCEVTRWIQSNLVHKVRGMDIPGRILIFSNGDWVGTPPPSCISKVPNLHQVNLGMYSSGIYFLCDNEQVVYVGQSANIAQRVKTHIDVKNFDRVYALPVVVSELNNVEAAFIKYLQPKYNAWIACKTEESGMKKSSPCATKNLHQVFEQLNFKTGELYGIAA